MIRTIEFSWEKILAYIPFIWFQFWCNFAARHFFKRINVSDKYCATKIVRIISPPPLGAHCIVTSQVVFLSSLQGYMLLSGLELWHWCSTRQTFTDFFAHPSLVMNWISNHRISCSEGQRWTLLGTEDLIHLVSSNHFIEQIQWKITSCYFLLPGFSAATCTYYLQVYPEPFYLRPPPPFVL